MHTQKYFDHQTISDDERRLNYVKRVSFNTLELFAGHYCDHQTRPCIAVACLMTHIGQGCSKPDKITYGDLSRTANAYPPLFGLRHLTYICI